MPRKYHLRSRYSQNILNHARLFKPYVFGDNQRATLDRDGHLLFPELLTQDACTHLETALADVQRQSEEGPEDQFPTRFAAEYNSHLESLIAHPQLLELARQVLGPDIRYDHCVTLNRSAGNGGSNWHTHEYSDDDTNLGFIRIFFYVNGFETEDGALKVVPGSHHFRDPNIRADNDKELIEQWLHGRLHPTTGCPMRIEQLTAPVGTVVLMWTHSLHGVTPRKQSSATRWTVVFAYRNPGRPSAARWINPNFEDKKIPGTEGLMGLY